MIDFSGFREAMVANAEGIEAQRIADAKRKKLASQIAMEKERLDRIREDAMRTQQLREENARIEQKRRDGAAAEERYQKRKKARLEDEAAQGEANRALFMFSTMERKTALVEFEKIKQAAEVQIGQDPRVGEFFVAWMRRKGESVNSLSDAFRIAERNYIYSRMLAFVEEKEMSPKAKRYFLGWVSPSIQPRPRRLVDDIKDLTMTMANARGGQVNPGLVDALLPALMTENVPGLQQPGQSFMMASQPQIARLQVNLHNPRRDLDYGKEAAAEHKQLIEKILKSIDIPSIVRAHNTSNHA